MSDFSPLEIIKDNVATVIAVLLVLIGLIVYYYVLMVRAIRQMLLHRVPGVLLTFAFLSLIPLPVSVILGVMILIIWHYHKQDYQAG